MTDNIDKSIHLTQQWLGEIQVLKQQMVELQRQRDEAWESSQKWCKLYNIEAEQRRVESQVSKQAIAAVKAELQQLSGKDPDQGIDPTIGTSVLADISQLTTEEELHAKLIILTQERERLIQALKMEKESHAQTRKSLTTALGDAIDSLAKARAGNRTHDSQTTPDPSPQPQL